MRSTQTPPDASDGSSWIRRWLALAAALVPDDQRSAWRREWEAELWYYERRLRGERSRAGTTLAIAWRLGGAWTHAVWLRQRLWRRDLIGQDVRHAIRALSARPGLAVVVLVTVGLGVGVNTAIFSVIEVALLRPMPFADPSRLVVVWPERRGAISRPEYVDVRDGSRSFAGLAAVNGRSSFSLTGTGEAARLTGVYASVNLFSVLGVDASLGRTFLPNEDQPGHDHVVVLSHGLWVRRFGSDRGIVGRSLTLHGVSRTVVGVMPAGFALPSADTELWVPLPLYQHAPGPSWHARYLTLIGRLKPGVTAEQAAEALRPIAAAIKARWPNNDPADIVDRGTVVSLHETMVGSARPVLAALGSAAGLLLLVACANIANLLLVRGTGRRREMAVRAALGAGRLRLARQLMTESLVLALIGGGVGVGAAVWAVATLVPLLPMSLGPLGRARVDGPVLIVALGLALTTGILAGLAPAWRVARADLGQSLRGRSPSSAETRRLQRIFTVTQVALATLLLVGAGLLVRSLWKLQQVDPGFEPAHVLAVRVTPPPSRYEADAERRAFYDAVLDGVAQVPGAISVGAIQHLPLAGSTWDVPVFPEGRGIPDGVQPPVAAYRVVTPDYFEAMAVRLVKGRRFSADDRPASRPVAIVSEHLARELWPGEDAVGRRLRTIIGTEDWIEVVGVVADVRADALDETPGGEMYRPYTQDSLASMTLVIRTSGDPTSLAGAVQAVVHRTDIDVAVSDIRPMTEVVAASVARPRALALLLLTFAAVAVLLGTVGVHGVVSYAASQRTHEFGVRVAMGASGRDVRRLVLGDGLVLVAVGLALGLGGSLLGSAAMASLLFGVGPADPLTLGAVAFVLGSAGLLAAWLPARRATRVDPVVALRVD
jgi:putative ABC transport system permease protein